MINFDTNNLIIVCYPWNAGGKFLINCLGLSDSAVFQDAELAQKQIDGNFNQLNKFEYIQTELSNTQFEWVDLNLGCFQLFDIDSSLYYHYPENIIKLLITNKVVERVSNSNSKFFIVAHTPTMCGKILNIWPNAKIIYFKNNTKFIKFRNSDWNIIRNSRGDNWPDEAPTSLSEFNNLSPEIQNEIESKFKYIKDLYITLQYHEDLIRDYPDAISWDTNNYFSIDQTVHELKKLYNLLDLGTMNEELVREYYTLWINKLKELK